MALFPISPVLWDIGWPTDIVGQKKCIFPQSAWTTVHLLANWHSGTKKCLKVRQVLGTTNSKVWKLGKVGPKIALFPTQPVQWYIWWPNDKVGPKITLFPTQPILWYIWWPIQPVLWNIWWPTGKVDQKLHFSTVSLYYGTFGGPLSKLWQKLRFSTVSLYYGTFSGPLAK